MWRDKAHKIINALCQEAWRQANTKPDGTRYKKHRPYTVPVDAQLLVEAIGKDDEEMAKSIFVRHAHDIVYK